MTVSATSDISAGAIAATPNKTTTDASVSFESLVAKTNAPILARKNHDAKESALMLSRIQQVGIKAYSDEQSQVKKMLKILMLLQNNAKPDMKKQLSDIVQHFYDNPPKNIDEMYNYMQQAIDQIPDDAPNDLKARMKKELDVITKLMTLSDGELDTLLSTSSETVGKLLSALGEE